MAKSGKIMSLMIKALNSKNVVLDLLNKMGYGPIA